MADYTDLPNTAVGVGGIPSGTTITALRDNPIAIAEGAVGAPEVTVAALELKALFAPTVVTARSFNTAYLNSLGYSIFVNASGAGDSSGGPDTITVQVDITGGTSYLTWATSTFQSNGNGFISCVIPPGARWRVNITSGATGALREIA